MGVKKAKLTLMTVKETVFFFLKKNKKKSFNISVPPSGIEEFAPCFVSFPAVLWCMSQSRPVPPRMLCPTPTCGTEQSMG